MDDLREKITGLEDLAGQLHVGSFAWVTVRRELVAVRTELVELRRQDTVLLKGGGPGQQVGEATTCADNRCPAVAGADSEAGAVQLIRSQRRGKGGDCSGSGPYNESASWCLYPCISRNPRAHSDDDRIPPCVHVRRCRRILPTSICGVMPQIWAEGSVVQL